MDMNRYKDHHTAGGRRVPKGQGTGRLPLGVAVALMLLLGAMAACLGGQQPTPTPEPTATPTPTLTPTPSPTPTPTPTATPTPSPTPSPTPTPRPTATPTPPPTPARQAAASAGGSPPSAEEIVQASLKAMSGVSSFHIRYEAQVVFDTQGLKMEIPVTLDGDFKSPDSFRGTLEMSFLGFVIETEMVSIGDKVYVKDPVSGQWTIEEGGGGATPEQFLESADTLKDLRLIGQETLEGEAVYRVTARVSSADLAPVPLEGQEAQGDFVVEYWIGVEDFLVRKVTIRGEMEVEDAGGGGDLFGLGSGPTTVTLEGLILFSDFGKPVEITAPEVIETPTPEAPVLPLPSPTPVGVEATPAPLAQIEEVDVAWNDDPPSLTVTVRGSLPDPCTEVAGTEYLLSDHTIQVTLTTSKPPDVVCAQVITPFEKTVSFDTGPLPPGDYTIAVNGVEATFTVPERTGAIAPEEGRKVVRLTDSFTFEPADLTFKAGETVELALVSEGFFHTFTVEELGIDQPVNPGQSLTLTVTFDQPGTYRLICRPHETLGMTGTITVQP